MPDTPTKLPGLSTKSEAQLREIYETELGVAVPAELTTTASLREAITTHRTSTGGASDEDEVKVASAADETIVAVKGGEEKHFNRITWDLLGKSTGGYEAKVAKPAELS